MRLRRTLACVLAITGPGVVIAACGSSDDPGTPAAERDGGDSGGDSADSGSDAMDASDALVDASPPAIVCAAAPCAIAIASGAHSVCTLMQGGAVHCWGDNAHGELGRGPAPTVASSTPAPVLGLTDVVQLSGAASEPGDVYCALRASGIAVCWGSNARGELGRRGDGGVSTESSPSAAPVDGLGAATAIFAGHSVACAALAGDAIACWGSNGAAQIPNLPRAAFPPSPVTPFALGSHATKIGIADRGTVALTSDGELVSWGIRGDLLGPGTGVLGREVSLDLALPAKIALLHVSAVTASGGRACAIANGRVYCWGAAQNTEADSVYPTPTGVGVNGAFAQTLSVGPRSACATLSDGTARCWGDNARGQLGAGSTELQPLPVPVRNLAGNAARIAAMRASTCAVLDTGRVQCWGQNDRGQLGNGTADALAHLEPQNVVFTP